MDELEVVILLMTYQKSMCSKLTEDFYQSMFNMITTIALDAVDEKM